ncbi:MAG: hypothetical protein ACK5B6_10395 [Bacteroidia bacterium]|jgi:hypothetical protein
MKYTPKKVVKNLLIALFLAASISACNEKQEQSPCFINAIEDDQTLPEGKAKMVFTFTRNDTIMTDPVEISMWDDKLSGTPDKNGKVALIVCDTNLRFSFREIQRGIRVDCIPTRIESKKVYRMNINFELLQFDTAAGDSLYEVPDSSEVLMPTINKNKKR